MEINEMTQKNVKTKYSYDWNISQVTVLGEETGKSDGVLYKPTAGVFRTPAVGENSLESVENG